jgi:hypothetical protein
MSNIFTEYFKQDGHEAQLAKLKKRIPNIWEKHITDVRMVGDIARLVVQFVDSSYIVFIKFETANEWRISTFRSCGEYCTIKSSDSEKTIAGLMMQVHQISFSVCENLYSKVS